MSQTCGRYVPEPTPRHTARASTTAREGPSTRPCLPPPPPTTGLLPVCDVHHDVVASSVAAYPDSTSLCRAPVQEGQRRVAVGPTTTSDAVKPVYGPSVVPRHVQFFDMTTKCGTLTPFAVEPARTWTAEPRRTPSPSPRPHLDGTPSPSVTTKLYQAPATTPASRTTASSSQMGITVSARRTRSPSASHVTLRATPSETRGETNLAQTMQHLVRQLEARRAHRALPESAPDTDPSRSLQACLADSTEEDTTRAVSPRRCYTVWLEGHVRRRVEAVSAVSWPLYAYVLYDADRGVDMGRVVSCVVRCGEGGEREVAGVRRRGGPFVLREATAEERQRWLGEQVAAAQETLEPCREAVASLQLPLRIVSAAYQFNMKKITFFYESDARVDFRQLLQTLFSQFHCRIWMERFQPLALPEEGGQEKAA